MEVINTPIALGFSQLECIEDTNEWNDDEPYCLMFVVDNSNPQTPLPPAISFRTKVFEDDQSVDEGDVRKQWLPIWGITGTPGTPAPIQDPNNIIVLAAMMENDSSDPDSVSSTVQATLTTSLAAARASGLDRAATVSKLINDMKGAISLGAASGGIDQDEEIDKPKELVLTANDLQQARNGHKVTKTLTFKDSEEDAEYKVSFVLASSKQWKGWVDLGGIFTSGPAVASWAPFRLDIFAKGKDNALWHKWWDDSQWHNWQNLGGTFKDSPAAVSWGPNRIDVFVRGIDDHIGHKWYNGSKWQGWQDLGGVFTSGPAAASWGANRLDIFAKGKDNALLHKWWDGAQWHTWQNLGGTFKDAPAAVSRENNRIDVFVRGMDDHIGHKWWDGSKWGGWEDLGGVFTSGPAVASWAANRLDIFAKGTDNALWHKVWDGSQWQTWQSLGGTFKDAPAAVSWGTDRIDVFVRGMDDHIGHKWWG